MSGLGGWVNVSIIAEWQERGRREGQDLMGGGGYFDTQVFV
jgi:hypothetical protein